MRNDWKYSTIGESCNVNYGTRVVRKRDGGSIYDVYGGGGATFKMDTYNREDCLVVSRFAMSPICTRFVQGKFFLNDSGLTLSPKENSGLRESFMNIILLANNDNIYKYGRGSAQRNLKVDEFCTMPISYPKSLSEQERIVESLDAEFEKIDTLKRNAEQQLQDAERLYKKVLKEIFTPQDNWTSIKLKDLAIYRRGSFPQPYGKKEWYDGEGSMPFVQVAELQENSFMLVDETARKISKIAQALSVFVPKGTVLVSLQGSIGKVAITQYDSYVDRTIGIFFDYKKEIVKEFFAYQLKLKFALEAKKARGTTIKTITKEEFANFDIRIAPYDEQVRIINKIRLVDYKLKALQANYDNTITLCNDLKQSLLKSIFA